jgi:hypothetical protein
MSRRADLGVEGKGGKGKMMNGKFLPKVSALSADT